MPSEGQLASVELMSVITAVVKMAVLVSTMEAHLCKLIAKNNV